MHRVLEPELMVHPEQVEAYAQADFSEPHDHFVAQIKAQVSAHFAGQVLDLGCGPGDISYRFMLANPASQIHAVDGSLPMLEYGKSLMNDRLSGRIKFIHARLPSNDLPSLAYDLIISNSLLHHLPDPQVLWKTVKQYAKPGTHVCIMDLIRPQNDMAAQQLVSQYAENESDILQYDFYHSLLAAFTVDEIHAQLKQAGLAFCARQISDRHVYISGHF
jgi:ubiquinone/menaquinone biosynthesis C-methylase UbiE